MPKRYIRITSFYTKISMAFHSKLPIEQGQIQLLWLSNTNISLVCEKLLRYLPGKRWVCFGHWGEREVVAKLFSHQRHAQRELNGIDALSAANILAPAMLYHGWATEKSLYVIVYEYIPYKQNLDEVWQQADEVARTKLIERLVAIVAQLHYAGLRQLDLHPQNFLLHDNKIYVLDAGEIVQTHYNQPLGKRLSLQNLGALLAQFPPRYDALCSQLYLFYTQKSSAVFTLTSIAQLKKWIAYWRKRRLIKFGKKAFRSCTQFVCDKSWNHFFACDRAYDTDNMRAVLNDPDQALAAPTTEILKAGNSSTVGKITVDGKSLVIKRYNLKNFWHAIKRSLYPTRAAKSWRNAQYLSLLDIATAKPVAMIEKRFGPFRYTNYVISEYIAADHLKNYLATPHISEQLTVIAENMAQLFANLHAVQIAHGDMKATNILLVDNKPVLLDLDAMYLYRTHWRWQRAARKDKERFMKNWEDQPELQQLFNTKDDAAA